jgi:hypothetical protein
MYFLNEQEAISIKRAQKAKVLENLTVAVLYLMHSFSHYLLTGRPDPLGYYVAVFSDSDQSPFSLCSEFLFSGQYFTYIFHLLSLMLGTEFGCEAIEDLQDVQYERRE